MKRLFLIPLLALLFGCAQNHFNVPQENLIDNVRVLGVVPIMVDPESDIKHPDREILTALVSEMNRKFELQFVRKVKETGSFATVALMDGNPRVLLNSMLFRREKRDDAAIQYNKYFWREQELKEYVKNNSLDAVMFIVVSGINRRDKVYNSNLLASLATDYNFLIMTAQILDANGTILWEYPNFRQRVLSYTPMVNLQYPDFSESEANLMNRPDLKFKTIEGIRRTLDMKKKDMLLRETLESEVYSKQFEEMLSFLKVDPDKDKKDVDPPPAKGLQRGYPPPSSVPPAAPVVMQPAPPKPAAAEPLKPTPLEPPKSAPSLPSVLPPPAPPAAAPVPEPPKPPVVERTVSPLLPPLPPEPVAAATPETSPATPLKETVKPAPPLGTKP